MELIEFKIRRFKELTTGILIDSGTKWSLIRHAKVGNISETAKE